MILLSALVLSDTEFSSHAGANRILDGDLLGGSFTGFGSNWPTNSTSFNYTACEIGSSLFEPVGGSLRPFENRNVVIVPDTTSVKIFDMNCNEIQDLTVNGTITTPPLLVDIDGDLLRDIVIGTSDSIHIYEYDLTSETFEEYAFFNISSSITALLFLDCKPFLNPLHIGDYRWCTALENNNKNTFGLLFDISVGSNEVIWDSTIENVNVLTDPASRSNILNNIVGTSTNSDLDGDYLIPICQTFNNALNTKRCTIINESAHSQLNFNPVAQGGTALTTKFMSVYIAKIGASFRVLTHWSAITGSTISDFVSMMDLNGNEKYKRAWINDMSNWVVVDYDKDGDNDACYLTAHSATVSNLTCYDASGTLLENVFVNMPFNESFAMGVFNVSNSRMDIVTGDGLASWNGTGYSKTFDSGFTLGAGTGALLLDDSVGMGYIYIDTSKGFIMFNDLAPASCGDNICQANENSFNCLLDCNPEALGIGNQTGDPCNIDTDCLYGSCQYGFCSPLTGGKECDHDNDCISGTCTNGKCTKPGYWAQIEASKQQHYGDDTDTNNFIALTIMIVIAGAVMIGTKSIIGAVVGIGVFVALGVFFTIIGWLSGFILLGILIVVIAGAVFIALIGGGSSD